MAAVMAMHGHGGWPLSAFLTPDQDFFFGGTYWPPTSRAHMPGFDRVLASVLDAWNHKQEDVIRQSKQITQMIQSAGNTRADEHRLDPGLINTAAATLHQRWDSTWGGFGTAPKFPHPMDLGLLLRLAGPSPAGIPAPQATPDRPQLLEMVELTLRRMAMGGIYDHLAGGFARYSVDERWLVPHFEKMLYDNALLARVYLQAFRITGDSEYADICRATLDYLLNDMCDPQGGLYSTEDADSEGEEGKFYVWTVDEITQALGEPAGQRFCQVYDVTPGGNFEGKNILNLRQSIADFAADRQLETRSLIDEMKTARTRLRAVRDQRIRPGRDDKIITSWNGMAIEALVDAGIGLGDRRYAAAALAAANFVWDRLRDRDGRLLHSCRAGQAKLAGYLDDYAWMACACLSCYRIDFDFVWIERAMHLIDDMVDHFFEEADGAFWFTADDHEQLIARTRDWQDGAVPGGNSMAALACLRLGRMSGNPRLLEIAERTMTAAMPFARRAPLAVSQMLIAWHVWTHDQQQYVLVLGSDGQGPAAAVDDLQQMVPLEGTLLVVRPDSVIPESLADGLRGKTVIDGQPALYVCQEHRCAVPLVGWPAISGFCADQGSSRPVA